MLSIKCPNCHEHFADQFCKNEFCYQKRLFCSENCLNIKSNHLDHLKDTQKIQKLPNFVRDIEKECQEMKEELEIPFKEVTQLYDQFQKGLLKKYSISDKALSQSNSYQINDALCRFVKFKEDKKILKNIFHQGINQFINSLKDCIDELNLNELNELELSPQEINISLRPFQYELIEKMQSEVTYYSFVFNHDSSIIVGGLDKGVIQIFEFKDELLNKKQQLQDHKNAVHCLQFMQKSNQFISGSVDGTINLYSLNQINEWYCSRKIYEDCCSITCLIINISENLIFSGSQKSSIKIFDKMKDWKSPLSLTGHNGSISSISLNPKEDMLVSCTEYGDQKIIIYQRKNQNWNIYQNIDMNNNGFRICFIDNRRFIFQPYLSKQLEIYEYNLSSQQFQKTSELNQQNIYKCDVLFPQQFIQSKSIIINKNGCNVNILRIMPNHEIKLEYTIKFFTEEIYGALNKNAQYLITYNVYSQRIELRKYIEQ